MSRCAPRSDLLLPIIVPPATLAAADTLSTVAVVGHAGGAQASECTQSGTRTIHFSSRSSRPLAPSRSSLAGATRSSSAAGAFTASEGSSISAFARMAQRIPRSRTESRLGYYRNFERVLGLVEREVALVALCDQDDRWHPDKLQVLRGALESGVTLAYSDMNLIDGEGDLISTTYWTDRRT